MVHCQLELVSEKDAICDFYCIDCLKNYNCQNVINLNTSTVNV
jgi:hypothetical protein